MDWETIFFLVIAEQGTIESVVENSSAGSLFEQQENDFVSLLLVSLKMHNAGGQLALRAEKCLL